MQIFKPVVVKMWKIKHLWSWLDTCINVIVHGFGRCLVKAGEHSLGDVSTTGYNTRGVQKSLLLKTTSLLRRNVLSCSSLNALLDNWMLEGCLSLLEKTFDFGVLQSGYKSQEKFNCHQFWPMLPEMSALGNMIKPLFLFLITLRFCLVIGKCFSSICSRNL